VNRPQISSISLLALAATLLSATALLGPAAARAATPRTESTRPFELVSFEARGSGGWVLSVSASPARGKAPAAFGLETRGPHHEEVDYIGMKARTGADGSIEAKLADGRGRIAVRFHKTSETVLSVHARKGCTVQGKSAILKGVFRGTIRFHGERGYTTVARRSARGEIVLVPGETCPRPKHDDPPLPPPSQTGAKYFLAGRDLDGGTLEFSVFRLDHGYFGLPPEAEITARFARERQGVLTIARTEISDEARPDFVVTPANGRPSEVTVAPPAPFSGSATFALESPTKSSWTGDLSVEVPTLGPVALTGPDFWSGACADRCTKTFPAGTEIGFAASSRLP
jgi:hypothetical protein